MINNTNTTIEQYSVWLITEMAATPDGPEFDALEMHFEVLNIQLQYLETCYSLPSYETPK